MICADFYYCCFRKPWSVPENYLRNYWALLNPLGAGKLVNFWTRQAKFFYETIDTVCILETWADLDRYIEHNSILTDVTHSDHHYHHRKEQLPLQIGVNAVEQYNTLLYYYNVKLGWKNDC